MRFEERQLPGDGTMGVVFACPGCGSEIAMLANPMETRLVSGLGIQIGGSGVPAQPLELTRGALATGGDDAFSEEPPISGRVVWSEEASERLGNVPGFVRGMVKRIYTDYARERGIADITPAVMDQARTELGLEGM
jgi:hypothetical protein